MREILFRRNSNQECIENHVPDINVENTYDDAVVCCDYGISENCVNPDSYGVICVKCGECGRTFKNGIKHPYIKHRRKNET